MLHEVPSLWCEVTESAPVSMAYVYSICCIVHVDLPLRNYSLVFSWRSFPFLFPIYTVLPIELTPSPVHRLEQVTQDWLMRTLPFHGISSRGHWDTMTFGRDSYSFSLNVLQPSCNYMGFENEANTKKQSSQNERERNQVL